MIYIPLWKRVLVALTVVFGTLFAVPTFLKEGTLQKLPEWLQSQVRLGLDLQGGSHLLLEVDFEAALRDKLSLFEEDVRKLLRKEKISFSNLILQNKKITFKLADASEISQIYKLLSNQSLEIDFNKDTREVTMGFDEATVLQEQKKLLAQSREIIDRRINALGTREPNIQIQGLNRIIVQLPGVNNPAQVKEVLGKTAKLTFQIVHPQYPTLESTGGRILPGTEAIPEDPSQIGDRRDPKTYLIKKQILLTGENLADAQAGFHPQTNAPVVHIRFDTTGARKFGEITRTYTHHQLAMVLDGKVIGAPNINEPILGGNAEITGQFSVQETVNLAILLRSGSLPAPIHVVEERTVGPDLGADSIAAGEKATLVSIILICAFMVVVYALFGLFANIALFFNLVFLMTALALTGSILTLPGIAGIALTLGMAVDANVLIFERIKEELRLGTRPLSAIESGYKRAMSTILDSNITTLIGGLALYFFGSGPIKGFGVTLCFGIIISMFTAITLTRVIVALWVNKTMPKVLPI